MARVDRLTKLIAVFDKFNDSLTGLDDPAARDLYANWQGIRERYIHPGSTSRSALASGMEQGLREMPMVLASLGASVRRSAAEALESALVAHYPEFRSKDAERLEKIKARGAIRGEGEYYLVRHQIDILEGDADREEQLQKYYEMVDRFEA